MAVANVACLLARKPETKKGVLMLDWDLEAPGLHYYFHDTRPAITNLSSPESPFGVIGLFEEIRTVVNENEASDRPLSDQATRELIRRIDIQRFVLSTVIHNVTLMPAGRFDSTYAERVTGFEWRDLFDKAPHLFRNLAEYLADCFDYVLIDSRTGMNDTSNICTSLMPDQLTLVFTPNAQSLEGCLEALKKASYYRQQSNDVRPLLAFPLPSRIDVSEPELLENWRLGDRLEVNPEARDGYQRRFEILFKELYELPSCDLTGYFDEVQVQHVPRYSYGEEIAVLVERSNRLSLSRSYSAYVGILTLGQPPWSTKPSDGLSPQGLSTSDSDPIRLAKEYIAEDRFKVKLFDLIARATNRALTRIGKEQFPVQGQWSPTEFEIRLHQYESACADSIALQALLGYWGESKHQRTLTFAPLKFCEPVQPEGGLTIWLALRWYPASLLLYSGGIAAVASGKYYNLRELLGIRTVDPYSPNDRMNLATSSAKAMSQLHDAFKTLPGKERRHTPRSEYLSELLAPTCADMFIAGSEYVAAFDRFEILFALQHAYINRNDGGRTWGPPGLFAWKRGYENPYEQLLAEAQREGANWQPIRDGLFGGSFDDFTLVAKEYGEILKGLHWY